MPKQSWLTELAERQSIGSVVETNVGKNQFNPNAAPSVGTAAYSCLLLVQVCGDVVQWVRTLPCRWLESRTVTAEPQKQLPHRTSITLLEWTAQLPKSGTARRASLKRFVKFAAQITSVSSTICPSSKNCRTSVREASRIAEAPRVTRSACKIPPFSSSSNIALPS